MKYVALLRGINVGGNNIIKMLVLKEAFEKEGFLKVTTFIQSGNVIFDSDEKNPQKLCLQIEKMLSKTFSYHGRIVLRSLLQIQKVVKEAPSDWSKRDDIRCYVAFVKEPVSAKIIAKDIKLREGIDFLKTGEGALYMTTLLESLTKSYFSKLVGQSFYQDITIRNFNTTRKILALMEKG